MHMTQRLQCNQAGDLKITHNQFKELISGGWTM
jgi:hypothetical protein